MIRQLPKIALLLGALAVAGQASAHGYDRGVGPGLLGAVIGGAVVGSILTAHDRPVYVQQAPVYVQPQPVYVQQPVYYQPAPPPPVYYAPPQPVYYSAPPGYYGYRRY